MDDPETAAILASLDSEDDLTPDDPTFDALAETLAPYIARCASLQMEEVQS